MARLTKKWNEWFFEPLPLERLQVIVPAMAATDPLRLQPHHWAGAYACWGIENREAAVRVPSRYWDDEAGSTNLELKASDSSRSASRASRAPSRR